MSRLQCVNAPHYGIMLFTFSNFWNVLICLHLSTIVTSSRMHGTGCSGEDRVDFKMVISINSGNKSLQIRCNLHVFIVLTIMTMADSLQWRHNEHDGISNNQPCDCLLKRLFRHRWKKTSKLRITGLCAGNSRVTNEFPHKGPVMWKMFPFDDVIMWKLTMVWHQESWLPMTPRGAIGPTHAAMGPTHAWWCGQPCLLPPNHGHSYIDGILPKGPYPPCLRMADRALLAGYPRYQFNWVIIGSSKGLSPMVGLLKLHLLISPISNIFDHAKLPVRFCRLGSRSQISQLRPHLLDENVIPIGNQCFDDSEKNGEILEQTSIIRCTKSQNLNVSHLVLQLSLCPLHWSQVFLCPLHWSQVLSREWRCSWSRADRWREVLVLWCHIHRLFLHVQIGAVLIFTRD